MSKLKCVIVEDSDIQRMTLERIINSHPDLVLVTSFRNAIEAKNGINNRMVDLIFLDIEMPLISGFELLETLNYKPQVIVVAGKPEHALKAFEYDVTDFLQKPILLTRFDLAIKRAMLKYEQIHINDDSDNQIFIKSKMSQKRININEIKWIEAKGDYVQVVTLDSNIMILSSLKNFHLQLPSQTFVRIHKSYVVNIERINSFNSKVVIIGNKTFPVSRAKKNDLTEALKYI
ncbi:MAG: LytTR family DNA-binding domain-containing protein [Flavobacteriaceae bacterium]|jgi:DNA-binding LytR/AlgR family response regulator|nr:LytTR family DNA-binding domain-containing protein [Flavobacteriaceae bacterium LSUCC0859]